MFLNFNLRNIIKTKERDKIGTLRYSTWYINVLSLIFSIIIVFILDSGNLKFDFSSPKTVLKAGFSSNPEPPSDFQNINVEPSKSTKEENWYLEIPSINLKAPIREGTTKEIMDKFIGHFEESKKWAGNVCLAAHNRGYENNYFAEAKQLKEEDKIIYHYEGSNKKYKIQKNDIIKATDLTCLEDTEENTITLITCVENEPDYRRCVKAIEIKP